MATITKRGDTYRIRAYCGYDAHGKQVTRSMTWKPAPGMTPNQIKKEVSGRLFFLRKSAPVKAGAAA